ncbi:MAG TPA: hypothetical protein VM100_03695 [Longimicrobiales bacterium]|nr:hypothetical protein [Longimicrobiales bacterium]
MTDRKYHEEDVRKIFKLATSDKIANAPGSSAASGLTLSEMQSIGLEVGVDPDAVARAAAALESSPTPTQQMRKSMGMPIEVGKAVDLARPLTDIEWDQVVGELRATFRAKGRVDGYGNLREWSNGNLMVTVEPRENGAVLRMRTLKGSAQGLNILAGIGVVASAGILAILAISGAVTSGGVEKILGPMMIGTGGAGAFVSNWIRLPRWAERRQHQMNYIAARVQELTKS